LRPDGGSGFLHGQAPLAAVEVATNIVSELDMVSILEDGPADARFRLVLAHGAGAPMTSPFMERMAALLAARGLAISRFEFGYMAARRTGGSRRPAPRAETLIGEYREAIERIGAVMPAGQKPLIGGKSMGGRVASLIAGELHARGEIAGLVCLGYPFRPPSAPGKLRTQHLGQDFRCPTLIVQGERDPFGGRDHVAGFTLSPAIRLHWAVDGDHDLKPRARSEATAAGNLAAAADAIAAFAETTGGDRG
jgi:predicted alpha/beta-hydrolase family hydrolase